MKTFNTPTLNFPSRSTFIEKRSYFPSVKERFLSRHRCRSSNTKVDHPNQFDDIWNRLALLKRQLLLSVQEEEFKRASILRDEILSLEASLPVDKQLLLALVNKLQNDSIRDKITAVQALGDLGDPAALPILQNLLPDIDLGGAAESSMWLIFSKPPPHAADLMTQGMQAMSRPSSWGVAEKIFTEVTVKAPSFAEGFNKRATTLYLMQRHADAINDCRTVLHLNPYHFGAASGMGMCCAALGDYAGALKAFQQALAINPQLDLRHHIIQLTALQAAQKEENDGQKGE